MRAEGGRRAVCACACKFAQAKVKSNKLRERIRWLPCVFLMEPCVPRKTGKKVKEIMAGKVEEGARHIKGLANDDKNTKKMIKKKPCDVQLTKQMLSKTRLDTA